MKRPLLALAVLALVAADASACGPVRGLFSRVRERIQDRRGVSQPPQFMLPGIPTSPIIRTPSADCPDGTCPLRRPVAQVQTLAPAAVVFEFPQRMP